MKPRDEHRPDWDQYQIDRAERWTEFERSLLTDEQVRNRRMLDDEERRCDSIFEQDWEDDDDGLSEIPLG